MKIFQQFVVLAFVTGCLYPAALAQTPEKQNVDVIRINTQLVQTDVMVFDKQGRLVTGLPQDDFELTLDGKRQPLSFFESVVSGTRHEAKQVAAARLSSPNAALAEPAPSQGRIIFFFLDDVHLTAESLARSRRALTEFVDNRMNAGDQLAIVSTSGQIGFLQQLTDEPEVLHEAIERLNNKRNPETYAGRTTISEYQANQVAEHADRNLFNYLVSSTINEYQLIPPKGGDPRGLDNLAVNNVRNRVRQINAQSRVVNLNTLNVLLSLMRSSAPLPGRKLLFFLSEGFITDGRASGALALLKQVTSVAAETGVVVYTMDVRGSYYDSDIDASRNVFPDGLGSGMTARNPNAEAAAMREPLRILADDTGGRALLESNSIGDSIQQAIEETSSYYLLAWRPDSDAERSGKARLKVTLRNHPDLRVRLRQNYFSTRAVTDGSPAKKPIQATTQPELELVQTLASLYPKRSLPVSLSVGYAANSPTTFGLQVSMQIDRSALGFAGDQKNEKREIDVLGAAIDDRGAIVSFKQVLTVVSNDEAQQKNQPVIWNLPLKAQPGLYQVRVAVRAREGGFSGSANRWIKLPELVPSNLQMSSLFIAQRSDAQHQDARPLQVNVDRHFTRGSILRYQTYLYNSDKETEIQSRILKNNQPVGTPLSGRPTNASLNNSGVPYSTEIPLNNLTAGNYTLEVRATKGTTKEVVSQRLRFVVD
jgi:VWFA-related protein